MKNIKDILMYLIVVIIIVALGVTFYIVYSNNNDDHIYMHLSAENERVRKSVEIYYLTEDEKENIFSELEDIDKLIESKDNQIDIFNKIKDISRQLIIYEKNNINADSKMSQNQ